MTPTTSRNISSWWQSKIESRIRLASWYMERWRALRSGVDEDQDAPYDLHFPFARLLVQSLRLLVALPSSVTGAPGARPTVVIAEPTLTGTGGHHREIALAAARAYRDMGFDVHVLASRRFRASAEDMSGDGIVPVPAFGATVYETLRGHRPAGVSFVANAESYAADLDRALRQLGVPRPSLIVFPTSSIVEIAGATLLRPTFLRPGSQERQAHLLYFDPRSPDLLSWSPYGPRFQRAVLRLLRAQLASGRLRLVADSPTTTEGLRAIGVPEAEEIALPITVRAGALRPDAPITVGFLGGVRLDKGARILPDIVAGVLSRAPTMRVVVQASVLVQDDVVPEVLDRLRSIRDPSARLTLLEQPLDSAAYAALLREVDILVLPYDPERYRTMTSGICLEGLVTAKVMVGPASGWIAEHGREGGAYVGVDTRSAGAVVEGIATATARFAELAREARANAPRFAERHAPSAFAAALAGRGEALPKPRGRQGDAKGT